MEKYLSRLIGGKITQIVVDDYDDTIDEFGEPLYALLVVLPDGTTFQVTPLSDPEGNGVGFLDIIKYAPD